MPKTKTKTHKLNPDRPTQSEFSPDDFETGSLQKKYESKEPKRPEEVAQIDEGRITIGPPTPKVGSEEQSARMKRATPTKRHPTSRQKEETSGRARSKKKAA